MAAFLAGDAAKSITGAMLTDRRRLDGAVMPWRVGLVARVLPPARPADAEMTTAAQGRRRFANR